MEPLHHAGHGNIHANAQHDPQHGNRALPLAPAQMPQGEGQRERDHAGIGMLLG